MSRVTFNYASRYLMPLPIAVGLLAACQGSNSRTPVLSAAANVRLETSLASPLESAVPPAKFTAVDFARHVKQLRARLGKTTPGTKFSIVIQPPFVVIGDESKSEVQERAEGTVKWAVDRLKLDYFSLDPKEILDIWLFKDAASYQTHARLLFNEIPATPYGYYSSYHKALIMNIETGGGTLVHEIVHPFMEANFPACPPWLNEGLGSLYEQCGEVDGHIHGYTNWRLPGLQRAIKAAQVPGFDTLLAMDTNAFYNEDKGVNYAQARYLCYYLQEKGLLTRFFREFQAHQKEDPSGLGTLKEVLAEPDLDAFKTRWEQYVAALRLP